MPKHKRNKSSKSPTRRQHRRHDTSHRRRSESRSRQSRSRSNCSRQPSRHSSRDPSFHRRPSQETLLQTLSDLLEILRRHEAPALGEVSAAIERSASQLSSIDPTTSVDVPVEVCMPHGTQIDEQTVTNGRGRDLSMSSYFSSLFKRGGHNRLILFYLCTISLSIQVTVGSPSLHQHFPQCMTNRRSGNPK